MPNYHTEVKDMLVDSLKTQGAMSVFAPADLLPSPKSLSLTASLWVLYTNWILILEETWSGSFAWKSLFPQIDPNHPSSKSPHYFSSIPCLTSLPNIPHCLSRGKKKKKKKHLFFSRAPGLRNSVLYLRMFEWMLPCGLLYEVWVWSRANSLYPKTSC